jgi:hypothetical protein
MEKPLPLKYKSLTPAISVNHDHLLVWSRKTILDFLNDSATREFVILGGDVVRFDLANQCWQYTYDNWAIDFRPPTESFEAYSSRARVKALQYIQAYPDLPHIGFSPTITSELTAGLK